jgi:hypothetical protein
VRTTASGSKTELKQTLKWYADNYRLPLITVRRNRTLLDRPRLLFMTLLLRNPMPNIAGLYAYLNAHPAENK